MATTTTNAGTVNNHDIVGVHNRINRFITEVYKSASSSVSLFNTFDTTRVMSYLTAIDTYRNWIIGQPQLDLPETNPRQYALEENPDVGDIENESIWDLIHMFELARDELDNSQSARTGAGLLPFDNTRLVAIIGKARSFMTDYVAHIDPLDLPESSPEDPSSGSGLNGI